MATCTTLRIPSRLLAVSDAFRHVCMSTDVMEALSPAETSLGMEYRIGLVADQDESSRVEGEGM